MQVQGIVLIEAQVTPTGSVTEASIARTSGFPRLDQAALRTVRSWKFEPATLGGIAIPSQVEVPVRFQLQ